MTRATAKTTRSITELHQDFEKANAAVQAIRPRRPIDRAAAHSDRIAKKILAAPAFSVAEMLLKIRVAGDFFEKGEELDAMVSLRADLERLAAGGNLATIAPGA